MNSIIQTNGFRNPLFTIFSFLDAVSLFKAKGVCKVWKEVSNNELLRSANLEKSLETGKLLHLQTLNGHAGIVTAFFSKDDELFTGSDDKTIKVWVRKNGQWQEKQTLNGHASALTAIRYVDGKLMTEDPKLIKIWEKEKDKWVEKKTIPNDKFKFNTSGTTITVGKYHITGSFQASSLMVSKGDRGEFKILTLDENPHSHLITNLFYSGGTLFTSSLDKTVKVWV